MQSNTLKRNSITVVSLSFRSCGGKTVSEKIMSVSAIISTTMVSLSNPIRITGGATEIKVAPRIPFGGCSGGLVIECSSRPQKKATAHHKKTRPRKTQAWDIRRNGPTVYPPLPPLPPEWTLVTDADAPADAQSAVSSPEPVES